MKRFIIAALTVFLTMHMFGQINLGVKAGYTSTLGVGNVSSVLSGGYNLKDVKAEMGNDFHIGGFARLFLGKLYVQPELLYTFGKREYSLSLKDAMSNNVQFTKVASVSVIDIPILLGYKILDLRVVNLRAFAGPKFRLNAGSSVEFKNLTGGVALSDLQSDIQKSQVGLEAGIGLDVSKLTLDVRYNLINDMYQTKLSSVTLDKLPNSALVISLGWKLL